jgi:Lactate dehydrogenase and related dehydrogenases
LTETTADFAWALLMAVARRVTEADRYIRSGKWKVGWHPSMLSGRDIHGATMGIVGAGRIGAAVAKRANGFNMRILFYDVMPRPELERELKAKPVDLETLLKESDFVSVHEKAIVVRVCKCIPCLIPYFVILTLSFEGIFRSGFWSKERPQYLTSAILECATADDFTLITP